MIEVKDLADYTVKTKCEETRFEFAYRWVGTASVWPAKMSLIEFGSEERDP